MAAGKSTAAVNGAWVVFEDEAGQSMTLPRARTWGRQGSTPVVRVRGRGSGRVSMVGMTCYKPGERSRLIYAIREYRGRKDEPKGFGGKDCRDLVIRAHNQLGGPIVLVWDNLRMHLVAPLREFFEANAAWLTVTDLRTGPQPAGGHLVPGQTRHRQPRRRRPGLGHPRGEAQAQDASVRACGHRRLPGGHWPGT
ncbi:transposase [Streptomyces sp. NPDC056723]|uniref:transposase n=1 Tax=Streptomyces sp. NPDC056723 TaxID=3345925 RepID=UPI0036C89F95